MNKKKLYEIMESIDSCMLEVENVCRIVRLFKDSFVMNDNNNGDCAAAVILDYLEPIEKHLIEVYGEVDRYMLDNLG